ncbi:MAG: DUF4410 domain-containing protein [Nitrospirota bacterium]
MKKMLLIMAVVALLIPINGLARMSAPGVLDKEDVMTDESLSKYRTIGIKLFSTDNVEYNNVDDEEKRELKNYLKDWQEMLARTMKNELNGDRVTAFIIDPDGKNADKADMIIEGEFSQVNMGSTFSRMFWGMGAGQAGITVKGKLIDAKTGKELATFQHESTSGLQGGDKWALVENRVKATGDKISEFVEKLSR